MKRKKPGPPKRWRSKEIRNIAEAVKEADGTIVQTENGRLRIEGPKGTAIIGSAPDAGHRALANTLALIERETGLTVTAPTSGKRAQTDRNDEPKSVAPRPRKERRGAITRWQRGDTYGFITSSEGQSWFVSRDSLPDGLTDLPEGTQVRFSGSPKPRPGKGYPEALKIQVIEQ